MNQEAQKLQERIAEMMRDFDALSNSDRRGEPGRIISNNLKEARAQLAAALIKINQPSENIVTNPIDLNPFGRSMLE
jgi:hypothetical protein